MTVQLLLVEDDLVRVSGFRTALTNDSVADEEEEAIEVLDRIPPTLEDAVSLFEGLARHGSEALLRAPIDAVIIDGFLPRDRDAVHAEPAAVELAIRITEIYDRAGAEPELRPRLIFTTAAPDACDSRAFVAYGGSAVLPKTHIEPGELRRRIIGVVRRGDRWTPPEPQGVHHGYSRGLGKYLRGLELAASNDEIARRINVSPSSVGREKNRLRHALGLPERASNSEIVAAAKDCGITWVPLKYEQLARARGVRPRLDLW